MSTRNRQVGQQRSGQQNKGLTNYYSSRATAWSMTGSMASQVVGMGIVLATSGSAWAMGLHIAALFGFTVAAVLAVMSMKKQDRILVALNRHMPFPQRIARPDRLRKSY